MHILYVLHQFYPEFHSGTERVTLNLARMAQRAGHRVQVLACMVDRQRHAGEPHPSLPQAMASVVDGVPVSLIDRQSLPASADSSFELSPALQAPLERWLSEQRFDVVHLMHWMRMGTVIAAVQRCGLPLVLTLTDFYPMCYRVNLVDQSAEPCGGPEAGVACARRCPTTAWTPAALQDRHRQAEAVMAYASARVVPSEYVARRYREMLPGVTFDVIAHGIDLLAMAKARASRAMAAATAPRPLTLGYVGSLIQAKGLQVLLLALAARPGLALRLRVAGEFHPGEPRHAAELRRLIDQDARVELQGQLASDEVWRLMQGLDLLCLPSLVPESFSLVVHEAAAAGVPSLVSNLGAPALAVQRGGGGAVVPAGSVADWADAIEAWAGDADRRAAWRAAVRLPMRIEEEAFLYEGLYRRALSAR